MRSLTTAAKPITMSLYDVGSMFACEAVSYHQLKSTNRIKQSKCYNSKADLSDSELCQHGFREPSEEGLPIDHHEKHSWTEEL